MSALVRIAPWAIAATLFAATVAHAQVSPFGLGNGNQPVEIFADHGIEWHQNESAYVARGNARAVRGDSTIYAQTLTAYYRKAAAGAAGAGANAQGEGGVQIYRVDAAGAVRIVGPSGTAYGDHAVYDVDKGILVMTGGNLKLVTERETITARDSLEYWQQDDQAVARGNAVAVSDQNRIQADILTAQFRKNDDTTKKPAPKPPVRNGAKPAPGADSSLDRMYAYGNVVVTTPEEVARGDRGTYNARTGIAVLTGSVKITRDKNQLNGDAAEMNLNTNVSRIIAAPNGTRPPVRALLIPNENKSSNNAPNGNSGNAGSGNPAQGGAK
jgi:lipopolysaccharide export system protein LptA